MTTTYPGAVDSLPRPTSSTQMDATGYEGDVVVDNLSDAVEAIETELGTDPAGSFTDVKTRLASADAGVGAVNTVAATGATETLSATVAINKCTMDEACTFTFPSVTGGAVIVLHLLGAFTPTFPAAVDWSGGSAPTYVGTGNGSLFTFATTDSGTTWLGSMVGSAYA